MADIIQLLPDNLANQIAAGEVIQRPASVVKELLENAVDAGASEIKLIIKDAGKTLIQVIDDGKGMSATDARLSFERHATSKIKNADDLFSITTKGFRGEALASIAAIAHVELLTKQYKEEFGQRLVVQGSKVTKQEIIQTSNGSNFLVKNLFFNVPARRKFLKSDAVELKHIMEEFHRVALAHSEIFMSFFNNGNEIYHLPPSNIKQRILNIFKKNLEPMLLPLNEDTDIINISGYVAKVEAAKKSNPIQYIFVNNRFIKSNYLNHAIKNGYDMLLTKDQYPVFFIYLDLDPAKIDVNVHPTKTEIKFDDESLIYNYIRVSVKHALGRYIVSPTLDFETDTNFIPTHSSGVNFRSFEGMNQRKHSPSSLQKENLSSWQNIYENITPNKMESIRQEELTFESNASINSPIQERAPYQLHNSYIISHIKSGYLIIDQQLAHQRIIYEKNLMAFSGNPLPSQKELFPISVEFEPVKAAILNQILPLLHKMGFEIGEFGKNGFVIHGTPSGMLTNTNVQNLIEEMIDQFTQNTITQTKVEESLARSYAIISSIKRGKLLSVEEMTKLIDDLFACDTPFSSPNGKKTFMTIDLNDIRKYFE
jgi:DNA mismatch repair protein MutL